MNRIKRDFDRILLIIFGLTAAVTGGLIIRSATTYTDVVTATLRSKPRQNIVQPLMVDDLRSHTELAKNGAQWGAFESSMFVSKPYVLKDGELVNPLKGDVQLHPPIDNEWLVKYQLPYWDVNVLNDDADGDGFSNSEEFAGKTDPTNSASRPSYVTKLRLVRFVQEPFRLKFSGSPDDGETFAINTLDFRRPTQFLKMNEMVPGTAYKLVHYAKKAQMRKGFEMNVSELTVQNQDTGERVVLVYDKVVNSPTALAELKNLWDGSTFRVKRLETFTFKPEESAKYKLLDVSDEGAQIQRVNSGQKFPVQPEK